MAENAGAKQPRRGPGRRFKPGQSGNPRGKIPGTRHRVTLLAEQLLEADIEGVVAKVVKAAKAGNMTAARLILDRVVPTWRGRPVAIALPELKSSKGAMDALATVVAAMGDGTLSPDEAITISTVIERPAARCRDRTIGSCNGRNRRTVNSNAQDNSSTRIAAAAAERQVEIETKEYFSHRPLRGGLPGPSVAQALKARIGRQAPRRGHRGV